MTDRSPRRIGVHLEADADGYLQCVAKDRPVQVPWDAAVTGVEVGTVSFEAVADGAGPDAFVLKVESGCVYGKDLAERIEPFKFGPGIAFRTLLP